MRRSTELVTILILGLSILGTTDAPASEPTYVEDQVLVDFQSGTSDRVVDGINSWLGASVQGRFRLAPGLRLMQLPAGSSVEAAVDYYRTQPEVVYAGPNWLGQLDGAPVFPNDQLFDELWGLHNTGQEGGVEDVDIDAPEAWSDRPLSATVVGIIDSAVDLDHWDLQANLWVNRLEDRGEDGVDDDGNGYIDDVHGWDFIDNDNNPGETGPLYHGTHVAGTVAAVRNNLVGVVGVNPHARIMVLRACMNHCPTDKVIAALDYATENGAQITNNSFSVPCPGFNELEYGYNHPLAAAVTRAHLAGALVVASAGNSNMDIDEIAHCPATFPHDNIIAVAAIDRDGELSSFSSYGQTNVDLGAPGVGILSTVEDSMYAYANGTSMAAPHVAGAASYLLGFPIQAPDRHLYVKQILLETVDEGGTDLGNHTVSGGYLNLRKALDRLLAENPVWSKN